MASTWRVSLVLFLTVTLANPLTLVATGSRVDLSTPIQDAFQRSLEKPYSELFESAPGLEFNSVQIERMRRYLKEAEKSCVKNFKRRAKALERQTRDAQEALRKKSGQLSELERHELHCRIQNRRIEQSQAQMFAEHSVPIAYANKQAKLDLIEKWPAEVRKIKQEIASGTHWQREYGDVQDIGFREIAPGQEKDIKRGKEAVDQMKQMGLMPKPLENEEVRQYVEEIARKVAARSDLRVPLNVTILESSEINAFALPGGYLFVHRGLLEAVEDESQLVGVLAHEMAHAAARHGHKLMKKATIASIIYQAAQITALILTGGVASLGTYYALEYGFYGLGLVLSLKLLGVSREYELEADQLGIQYAWNSGYDPSGFIRFFDKMATTEGYVKGASWFRTHPPFYERMVDAQREIMFLPKKEQLIIQTPRFQRVKKELEALCKEAEQREKEQEECRPSLLAPLEEDCPPPNKIDVEPGQPIESICFPSKAAKATMN